MPIEFYFTPELHLKDGRIIRDLEDAASFAREHELRPGIDQRDDVLHKLERAESQETAHALRAMGGGTRPSGLAASSFVEALAEPGDSLPRPDRNNDRLGCRDKIEGPSQAPSREFDLIRA